MTKLNPIEEALLPALPDLMDQEEKKTRAWIKRMFDELADHDWSLSSYAPLDHSKPRGYYHNREAEAKRNRLSGITERDYKAPKEAERVMPSDRGVERLVECRVKGMENDFLGFIAKMVGKAGKDAVSAKLIRSGINGWHNSIIEVEHADGTVSKWRTNMIVNVSKLGRYFNQWPTRKLK